MNIFYFYQCKRYLIGAGTKMSCERSAADVAGTWTNIADLPSPGTKFTAMVTLNGMVYVMGGYGLDTSVLMHDGATPGTWTSKAAIPVARVEHSVLALDNDRALLCGGKVSTAAVNACYIYTASTDSWATTMSMAHARSYFGLAMSESMSVTTVNNYIYYR